MTTGDITNIIIATAAVIGLVPLGVRAMHDMIKNRRRKKNNDMLLTVATSVVASNLAPPLLTELAHRLGAVAEQLPPWAKAALGAIPPTGAPTPQSAPPQVETQPAEPSTDRNSSPNGAVNAATP